MDDAVARAFADHGSLSVPRLWPELFTARGIVPMGTAVLALVIGVTAGLLVRRSIPAMAVTLVAVIAVQILLPSVVQAHLMAPRAAHHHHHPGAAHGGQRRDAGPNGTASTVEVPVDSPGAWITYNRTVDSSRRRGRDLPVLGR